MPPAVFHGTDGGIEVEGLQKAGLNHRRADSDAQDQQADIGQGCRARVLTSEVAMSGSLFGCENAVNAYSRELSGGCATYLPVGTH
jgi:hypothetical protein